MQDSLRSRLGQGISDQCVRKHVNTGILVTHCPSYSLFASHWGLPSSLSSFFSLIEYLAAHSMASGGILVAYQKLYRKAEEEVRIFGKQEVCLRI